MLMFAKITFNCLLSHAVELGCLFEKKRFLHLLQLCVHQKVWEMFKVDVISQGCPIWGGQAPPPIKRLSSPHQGLSPPIPNIFNPPRPRTLLSHPDYLGLFGTILDYMGLSGIKRDYLGLFRTIQDFLGLYETIPDYLGLYGTISDYGASRSKREQVYCYLKLFLPYFFT